MARLFRGTRTHQQFDCRPGVRYFPAMDTRFPLYNQRQRLIRIRLLAVLAATIAFAAGFFAHRYIARPVIILMPIECEGEPANEPATPKGIEI